tara:strand:- start:683 stop:1444 length:762 start_codon:yes stop_codon:yes gene_type:complete
MILTACSGNGKTVYKASSSINLAADVYINNEPIAFVKETNVSSLLKNGENQIKYIINRDDALHGMSTYYYNTRIYALNLSDYSRDSIKEEDIKIDESDLESIEIITKFFVDDDILTMPFDAYSKIDLELDSDLESDLLTQIKTLQQFLINENLNELNKLPIEFFVIWDGSKSKFFQMALMNIGRIKDKVLGDLNIADLKFLEGERTILVKRVDGLPLIEITPRNLEITSGDYTSFEIDFIYFLKRDKQWIIGL